MNYEEDLAVDPHALDEEILRHPALYMRYAAMLTEAQKEQDDLKQDVDLVQADMDSRVREAPDAYGIQKITESAVKSAITMSEAYRAAESKHLEAVSQVKLLTQVVRAFEHRKKALELLVQLHIAQYFAGPKEPRNLAPGKRYADQRAGEATKKTRGKLNRRRAK